MARQGGLVGVYARPADDLRRFRLPAAVAIAPPGDENLSDSSSDLARFDSFAGDFVAGEAARDFAAGDFFAAGVGDFFAAGAGDFFAGDLAARGDFFTGAAAGEAAAGAGAAGAAGAASGALLVRK